MTGCMTFRSPRSFIVQKYPSTTRQFGRTAKRSAHSQWFMRAQSTHAPLRIVFVSTEVAPWSKVGGLADVVSALPIALASRGHKVMTVAPRYEAYPDTESTGIIVPIRLFSDVERDAGNEKRLSKDAIEPNWHETDPSMPSHDKDELRENARANAFAELYDVNSINSNGVIRVFVDHPKLNTGKNIYNVLTYMEGSDLADLDVRYSILCQAALGAAVLHPELNDAGSRSSNDCGIVLVGNDWPTALLLLHLKHSIQDTQPHGDVLPHDTSCKYSKGDEYMDLLRRRLSSAGTVMCIHNLAYQGLFPLKVFERLCLPCNAFAPLSTSKDWKEFIVHQHSPNDGPCTSPCLQDNKGCADADEWQLSRSTPIHAAGGNLNFLRSALLVCDKIITVSPSYANEIQSPEMGYGLNDILSCRGVMGIMNGIDTTEWNPKTDKFLKPEWRFDIQDFETKKVAIKLALQEKLGLIRDPTAALYVFIGRLTEQKGVDVLLAALPMVFLGSPAPSPRQYDLECHRSQMESSERGEARMIQMAMLGTGDSWMERSLECLSLSFPGCASGLALFSEQLAHLMLAAADYVIVPSRFEPCGLIAQCALRYGAVPIVTAVGGLRDLVTSDVGHVVPSFSCANDPVGQQEDIKRVSEMIKRTALECGSPSYRKLQQSCMQKDLSWDKPAEEWEEILNQVAQKGGGCEA